MDQLRLADQPDRARPYTNIGHAKAKLDALSGITDWRLHDLRRAAATGMQKLGCRLEAIEAALGHISGSRAGIVGVYQRHAFTEEARDALAWWGHASPDLSMRAPERSSNSARVVERAWKDRRPCSPPLRSTSPYQITSWTIRMTPLSSTPWLYAAARAMTITIFAKQFAKTLEDGDAPECADTIVRLLFDRYCKGDLDPHELVDFSSDYEQLEDGLIRLRSLPASEGDRQVAQAIRDGRVPADSRFVISLTDEERKARDDFLDRAAAAEPIRVPIPRETISYWLGNGIEPLKWADNLLIEPETARAFCRIMSWQPPWWEPRDELDSSGDRWSSAEESSAALCSAATLAGSRTCKRYPQAEVDRWYLEWIARHQDAARPPTREQDLEAAREMFGDIGRQQIRNARNRLAQGHWRRRGPKIRKST